MIASYLRKGHDKNSYSSGSNGSDSTSEGSSVLSFGSSGISGSLTYEDDELGWKAGDRRNSTKDDRGVEDEEDDWCDEGYEEEILGSPSDLSSELLPRMSSLTFRSPASSSNNNASKLTSPHASHLRRSPRHHRNRPGSIDTYSTNLDEPAVLCSGLPIGCRSLDSQISALDRTCENLRLDDFPSNGCVEKPSHTRVRRGVRGTKEKPVKQSRSRIVDEWVNEDSFGGQDEDEVEIVFDKSEDDKNEGGLWDGLMLWEVKAPGNSPNAEKRRFRRARSRETDVTMRDSGKVVVFSPMADKKSRRRVRRVAKSPRGSASYGDKLFSSSASVLKEKGKTFGKQESQAVLNSRGHLFRPRGQKQSNLQTASTTLATLSGSSPNKNLPQHSAPPKVNSTLTGINPDENPDEPEDHVTGGSLSDRRATDDDRKQKHNTILKNPLLPGEKEEINIVPSPVISEDDQEPTLHIFLTRVPVYPETPSNEASMTKSPAIPGTPGQDDMLLRRSKKHENHAWEDNREGKSPSALEPLHNVFSDQIRHVNGAQTCAEQGEIELVNEGTCTKGQTSQWLSSLLPKAASSAKKPRKSSAKKPRKCLATASPPTKMPLPKNVRKSGEQLEKISASRRDPSLYDSEGNRISPTTLQHIALAPNTSRITKSNSKPAGEISHSAAPVIKLPIATATATEFGKKKINESAKKPRRLFGMTPKVPLDRASSFPLKMTPPLEKRQRSDTALLTKLTSLPCGPAATSQTPVRRSISLSQRQARKLNPLMYLSQLPHQGKSNETRDICTSLSSNSILASSGDSKGERHNEIAPADEKNNLKSNSFTNCTASVSTDAAIAQGQKYKIDTLNTSMRTSKPGTSSPIEFSPVEFPIVSKQICTADHLGREFVIQGGDNSAPVVLYPLLDFNPCYDVFIFPTDVDDHTFEKRQTATTGVATECIRSGACKKSQPAFEVPLESVVAAATDGEPDPTPTRLAHSTERPSPIAEPVTAAKPSRHLTGEDSGDRGIEVALAAPRRGSLFPFGRNFLGYVPTPLRPKRTAIIDDGVQDLTEPVDTGDGCPVSAETESRPSVMNDAASSQLKSIVEADQHPLATTSAEDRSHKEMMCQPIDLQLMCADPIEADTASLSALLPNPLSYLLESTTSKVDAEAKDGPTEGPSVSLPRSRSDKHVTFRKWHLPAPFGIRPKPSGELKSILRSTSSIQQRQEANDLSTSLSQTPMTNRVDSQPHELSGIKGTVPGIDCAQVSLTEDRDSRGTARHSTSDARVMDTISLEPSKSRSENRERVKRWIGRNLKPSASERSSDDNQIIVPKVPSEVVSDNHVKPSHRVKRYAFKATDTSSSGATAGIASRQENRDTTHSSHFGKGQRQEIPMQLPHSPLFSDSAEDYDFLDESPPTKENRRYHRSGESRGKESSERSSSVKRVSEWISKLRPPLSGNPTGLSKRDRRKILKRYEKAACFDDKNLFGDVVPTSEKAVYTLLTEGNKSQADIYRILTEIAIARKKPHQSLAQAMNDLEREVFEVYTEKCRIRRERKLKRREFDRRIMRAIQKKTERMIREETEKARRHSSYHSCQSPSLFQEAVDFFSSLVVCSDEPTTPNRARPRTPPARSHRARRRAYSSESLEEVVYQNYLRDQSFARHHS